MYDEETIYWSDISAQIFLKTSDQKMIDLIFSLNVFGQEKRWVWVVKLLKNLFLIPGQISETSPHKIFLKKEVKSEILEITPKSQVEEIQLVEQEAPKTKSTKVTTKLNNNQSLNKDSSQNHKLTEYFTVRRSVRKPKNVILEEKQKCLEDAVLSEREDGLQVHFHS